MFMKLTRCKISKNKQNKLIELFLAIVIARTVADLVGINRKQANLFYTKLRHIIAYNLALELESLFAGEVELDESYFGEVRKGKRGRGAAGKVAVFGILKRHGKVYTQILAELRQTH